MITELSYIGRRVLVRTKQNKKPGVAPALEFKGKLVNVQKYFIELEYKGHKAVQNQFGKVVDWEPGIKTQRIYGSSIDTVSLSQGRRS